MNSVAYLGSIGKKAVGCGGTENRRIRVSLFGLDRKESGWIKNEFGVVLGAWPAILISFA